MGEKYVYSREFGKFRTNFEKEVVPETHPISQLVWPLRFGDLYVGFGTRSSSSISHCLSFPFIVWLHSTKYLMGR